MNLENRLAKVEARLPGGGEEAARRLAAMPDSEFYGMVFSSVGMKAEGAELLGLFQRAGMTPADPWFPWGHLQPAEEARARALLEAATLRLRAQLQPPAPAPLL